MSKQMQDMKGNIGSTTALVMSFDTTGSMSRCINDVRTKLRELAELMLQDIPGLRIGIIAHGDYCDGDNCISILDLTDDVGKVMDFIRDTPNTGGGDFPECYEYVLNQAKFMSWPEEGGTLILIGDASPHEENPNNLDWRKELRDLKEKKIEVFAMQCLKSAINKEANEFWETTAKESGTPLLLLEGFEDSMATIGAVAYASVKSDGFYASNKARIASRSASTNFASNAESIESYVKSRESKPK